MLLLEGFKFGYIVVLRGRAGSIFVFINITALGGSFRFIGDFLRLVGQQFCYWRCYCCSCRVAYILITL